jgi:hypothetical protein
VRPLVFEFPRSNASPEEIKAWLEILDKTIRQRSNPPPRPHHDQALVLLAWALGCGLAFCVGMIAGAMLRMVTP